MSEDMLLEPKTIYEGTKAACTMLSSSYSYTYNIPIFIIRPFTIYGIGEKPNKLLQILFKKMRENDKQIYLSDGVHDYVYIDDFINAVDNILQKNTNTFDILNVGTGIQISNIEVIKTFEKVTNYYFEEFINMVSKPYDSLNWVCDTSKLDNYYNLSITLEEGIKKMLLYNN